MIEKSVNIPITLGHALFVWETLNNHFSNLNNNPNLSENEKKAMWGLTDLIEETLVYHGITGDLDNYQTLVKHAELHLQNQIKVDFVDK